MSFSGELADRPVAELLNSAADSKWSGKLRLSCLQGEGVVLFDRGLVGYAASNALRETFGSILVAQKKITRLQLEKALDLQRAMSKKSLGSILVELGVLSQEAMNQAVRLQVRRALADLLDWRDGRYEFQPMVVTGGGYVSVPLQEVIPAEKLERSSQEAAMQPRMPGEVEPEEEEASDAEGRLQLFRRMSLEVRSPAFTGEMVSRVLGVAGQVVERAVLFGCRPEGYFGIGQTGVEVENANADHVVRSIVIPADTTSILRQVCEVRESVKRPLEQAGGDATLVAELGGQAPIEGLAVPVIVNNRAMVVLYGDNFPHPRPIGAILELELLMIQAGMSVENNLLQKRLQHYETLSEPQAEPGEAAAADDSR